MLERTLQTQFVPGTNLRGEVAGANWTYLLPSLELEHILCLGAPLSASLAALARLGHVSIAAPKRAVEELGPLDRWGNVTWLEHSGVGPLALAAQSVDLVLVTRGARSLDAALCNEIARVLRPDGLLWAEISGPRAWLRRSSTLAALRSTLGGAALYWLTPLTGEVHTAVPLSQPAPLRYFLDRGLYSPTLTLQRVKRAGRGLKGAAPRAEAAEGGEPPEDGGEKLGRGLRARGKRAAFQLIDLAARGERRVHRSLRAASRHGVLAGSPAAADGPPAYLQALAEARGLDLSGYRWGLWAAGAYSSRKLLFFLFPPGESSPAYLVKMVRDPAFNDRLENERRALERLAGLHIGGGVLPRVPFAGRHAGLAIVAETAIEGRPFRAAARWKADDLALHAAINWLIQLGAQTTTAATPDAVADALAQLFAQFCAIYRLAPDHESFLADRIAALRGEAETVPLVFQHGDPGTWNVLVTPQGQIAFIDWESAEPDGLPLWDLFYFLRSYVVSAARAAGQHDRLAGFSAHFFDAGPLSDAVVRAVWRYREQIGVSGPVTEALFYTCWLHRALKQATLLPPERLDRDGHYANLLRLCIQRRESPTLRRLFGT